MASQGNINSGKGKLVNVKLDVVLVERKDPRAGLLYVAVSFQRDLMGRSAAFDATPSLFGVASSFATTLARYSLPLQP